MAKKEKKTFSIIRSLLTITLILASIVAYSYFIEPRLLTFKEYPIKDERFKTNFKGFKIVHISDIHYGRIWNKTKLQDLVDSINDQKPDIVVLTGDLIDKNTKMTAEKADEIANILKGINTTTGKYAITGDQDLKFDEWNNIIANSEFKDLNNTYDTIYKDSYQGILIAGTSTASDKQDINDKLTQTKEYINSFEKDGPIYKILLMHEPDYIDEINNNDFDLILAGHSLGRQINIPLNIFTLPKGAKKYYGNYYKIENTDLYVSNGLGTTDYDFRFLSVPSYNIYRFSK
ncbi:MAG: metallophosphoesterase [Bacilli bacterium]|nr:metallophosphoesterase [Bacilli bacterium]